MPSLNKVLLMGNLTRDPELRYTPKGLAVAKLSLAINRTWKSESGELREEVTFVDAGAFGRQAETLASHVKKGRPLFIEGRLKLDQWDDKQTGQKRSKLNVIIESFQFLDSGRRDAEAPAREPAQSSARPSDTPQPPDVGTPHSHPDIGRSSNGGETPPDDADDVPF